MPELRPHERLQLTPPPRFRTPAGSNSRVGAELFVVRCVPSGGEFANEARGDRSAGLDRRVRRLGSADAWRRTVDVARQAERLGFESIWLFDHFHTVPRPTDEITFESFTSLAALAAVTERVRLGHVVICTAFRNPALTAKMISTMDTISGGRMELGIGAGWKRDEWLAYGYGFPETKERLARLADDLEVISADARAATGTTTRRSRASTRRSATRSTSRSRSSSRASRSWSAATART